MSFTSIILVLIYLMVLAFLGWKGYRSTKTASDYLVAGRGVHPYIMALSFGATFISTSAIVGFGGTAGVFGLGVLWLTFLNIFVGIFIAFVFFGKRTRTMGHHLNAHTFPELLGRRYQSKFLQIAGGLVILSMVVYAAAVLTSACRSLEGMYNIDYNVALALIAVIVTAYVITGGLKGVMYTDALQGTIMFVGMVLFLIMTFSKLGGVGEAHKKLEVTYDKAYNNAVADLKSSFNEAIEQENTGKTQTVALLSDEDAMKIAPFVGNILWMTKDKSDEVKKSVAGGLFAQAQEKTGLNMAPYFKPAIKTMMEKYGKNVGNLAALSKLKFLGHDGWTNMPKTGTPFWWLLISTIVMGVGIGVLAQPQLTVRFMTVKSGKELNRAVLIGGVFILMMTGVAFVIGSLSNAFFYDETGMISIVAARGEDGLVIPNFLRSAMPGWFNYLFLLTLLSAAMSTLSSQFHTMGTAISRDIAETSGLVKESGGKGSIITAKISIFVLLLLTVVISYFFPEGYIAAATAMFFGLSAASFLPSYIGGLYWRRATKAGAISSLVVGFLLSAFWLLFAHTPTMGKLGVERQSIFGKGIMGWIDPLVIALPISLIIFVVVSLLTKPISKEHLDRCYKNIK